MFKASPGCAPPRPGGANSADVLKVPRQIDDVNGLFGPATGLTGRVTFGLPRCDNLTAGAGDDCYLHWGPRTLR